MHADGSGVAAVADGLQGLCKGDALPMGNEGEVIGSRLSGGEDVLQGDRRERPSIGSVHLLFGEKFDPVQVRVHQVLVVVVGQVGEGRVDVHEVVDGLQRLPGVTPAPEAHELPDGKVAVDGEATPQEALVLHTAGLLDLPDGRIDVRGEDVEHLVVELELHQASPGIIVLVPVIDILHKPEKEGEERRQRLGDQHPASLALGDKEPEVAQLVHRKTFQATERVGPESREELPDQDCLPVRGTDKDPEEFGRLLQLVPGLGHQVQLEYAVCFRCHGIEVFIR